MGRSMTATSTPDQRGSAAVLIMGTPNNTKPITNKIAAAIRATPHQLNRRANQEASSAIIAPRRAVTQPREGDLHAVSGV